MDTNSFSEKYLQVNSPPVDGPLEAEFRSVARTPVHSPSLSIGS